jgi:uncharacterized protein
MDTPDWRHSVIDYIRVEATPEDKFGHQPRLYALACRLGQGLDYDDDIVFAAAWMHDLGVFLGHRPSDPAQLAKWDHVPYTVARTRELLPAWGFPLEKLDDVEEAIRTHQAKDSPGIIEAVLIHDADILEQLGAIGVARALVKVGRDTRYQKFSSVLPVLRAAIADLPGKLRLAASKEMAAPRIEALRLFVSSLEREANGLLY